MILSEFQDFLYQQMPLTRSMGLKPTAFSGDQVRFHLPLQPNTNDKGTAFGGSTSAAMILAGWSLVHLNLQAKGHQADVVIYRSCSQWQRPLKSDATVVARFQTGSTPQNRPVTQWGRRRQRISCQISVLDDQGREHSQMQADYVILPTNKRAQPVQEAG